MVLIFSYQFVALGGAVLYEVRIGFAVPGQCVVDGGFAAIELEIAIDLRFCLLLGSLLNDRLTVLNRLVQGELAVGNEATQVSPRVLLLRLLDRKSVV